MMDTHATHQDRIAFYLTGRRAQGLAPVAGLKPALQAGYGDLAALRHDFPLVLVASGVATSLCALVDKALADTAVGPDAERTRRQVLRVEKEIRVMLGEGVQGTLGDMWRAAVQRLAPGRDAGFAASARKAWAAMKVDGPLLDCEPALPQHLLDHAWQQAQQRKEASLRDRLVRLIQQLSDILRADFERSDAGRSPVRLAASVGDGHSEMFDFEAMSRLLSRAVPHEPMPEARRERIRRLLGVLDSQPFVALPDRESARTAGHEAYGYRFDTCTAALAAWRERLPRLVALSSAIEMAQMEIEGRYQPQRHDALFEAYGANGLDPEELSRFPDYFVCLDAGALDASEQACLMEILASDLPIKLLYRIDDLFDASRGGPGAFGPGLRARQIAHMATGLNQVYVLQSPASNLVRCGQRLADGMQFAGPALFCIFTGAKGGPSAQAPYLTAAAAMESRAFPAFVYDPSGGSDWASRFSLEWNAQSEADWPVHRFEFEDARHQRMSEDVSYTFADFMAGDPRFAEHAARLPGVLHEEGLGAVGELLLGERRGLPERVPSVRMIDEESRLHTVVVDERLMREARRVREMWHSLQELGGVHNSHARRQLEKERSAWEADHAAVPATAPTPSAAAQPGPASDTESALAVPPMVELPAEAERSRDDAYIETPRCSTCNECTQINPKMFAYDANRQAYIADLKAGTYAQLVEAAESCQVSVIHPGKPSNPNEAGIEELLKRAEAFR